MPNFSGIWTVTQQMQARGASTWPATPGAPTIGTATAGTALCASVTFTAPGCTGAYPATVTGYKVTSTPGCFTQTGASSPLVVTGLTAATSYTFKAQATNGNGYGALSAASNSITATLKTCATYTTAGTYSWVAPTGVTSVAVVSVGGGGGGIADYFCGAACGVTGGGGGSGAGLGYTNAYSVTPGSSYSVVVGASGVRGNICGVAATCGGCSYFISTAVVKGGKGIKGNRCGSGGRPAGGTYTGTGGGNGGTGGNGQVFAGNNKGGGGGGAGGYSGAGGDGGQPGARGFAGTGGSAGGGGYGGDNNSGGGGGVGILGQGASGAQSGLYCSTPTAVYGFGGSGGANGTQPNGGAYGGGGGGGAGTVGSGVANANGGTGGVGAVRLVWCIGGARGTPSFPSTNVGA